MRLGILDLGTNTFNLLVVDLHADNTTSTVFKTKIPVMLGSGGINKKTITPEAFQRGLNALKSHKALIDNFHVHKVFAFGTSALRNAKNGKQFVKAAKDQVHIDIQLISGEKEAELIYYGVQQALEIGEEPSLVLDIGGGSNEMIIGTSKEILSAHSFEIGAARMIDMFTPSDPITKDECTAMEEYFTKELSPIFEAVERHPVKELIGSSGSFDTFAALVAHKFHDPAILKGKREYTFDMNEYKVIHEALLHSTREERMKMNGMTEMRVDMIVVSTILVNLLLTKLNIERMRLSTFALKEGILHTISKTKL
jgi:exopolyphosphatase/guanosine-5'-triphosphate,3'-diphosphate pyrophosphatase